MRRLLLTGVILAVTACGDTPSRLGIRLDEVGVSRSRVGPAPADAASRSFLPNSTTRVKQADVLGDEKPEILVEVPGGSGVEIRDQSGALIRKVTTPEYLTDFGAVPEAGTKKQRLVLYTYPNPQKGGTFRVLGGAFELIATWDEFPPPGRFGVGEWGGQPALFYIQGDALVVRSPSGARLQELAAPEGHIFRDVLVRTLANGHTATVLSGSGYTPYHMVCVYEGARLVLQDVEDEHAFDLESTVGGSEPGSGFKSGFVVTTRNTRWQYALR